MAREYEVLVCYSTDRYTTHIAYEVTAQDQGEAVDIAWNEFSQLEIQGVNSIDYIVCEIDEE